MNDVVAPDVRRRNTRLGLIIGGIVLAIVATFMTLFSRFGLPKDPGVWRRLEREQALRDPVAAPAATPTVSPAPALPTPEETHP